MSKANKKPTVLRKRGRPETRIIRIDGTPEKAARAIFCAVKKPDPSIRVKQKPDGEAVG